jgi:hypothetical protein
MPNARQYHAEFTWSSPRFEVYEASRHGQTIRSAFHTLMDAVLYAAQRYVETGDAPDIFDDTGLEFDDLHLWSETVARARRMNRTETMADLLTDNQRHRRMIARHIDADTQRRRAGILPGGWFVDQPAVLLTTPSVIRSW